MDFCGAEVVHSFRGHMTLVDDGDPGAEAFTREADVVIWNLGKEEILAFLTVEMSDEPGVRYQVLLREARA